MRIMRKYLVILLLLIASILFLSTVVNAADHAVRPPASCPNNGDGTSWACAATGGGVGAMNALPLAVVHGDTYYLAGGAYAAATIGAEGYSGSTWAYVKKATTAVHGVTTAWDNAYATDQATFPSMRISGPYIEIDGVTGSGATGYGIKFEQPLTGLYTNGDIQSLLLLMQHSPYGPANVTVKYCEISMAPNGCDDLDTAYAAGWKPRTYTIKATVGMPTNIKIDHCYIHGGSTNLQLRGWTYSEISNNYWGENCSKDWSHGQQISPGGSAASGSHHVKVYNNEFHDTTIFVIGSHQVFTPPTIAGGSSYWDVYNNLVVGNQDTISAFAMAESAKYDGLTSSTFHHNTFVGVAFGGRGSIFVGKQTDVNTTKSYAYNNLFYDCTSTLMESVDQTAGALVHDYNAYLKSTGNSAETNAQVDADATDPFNTGVYTINTTWDAAQVSAEKASLIGKGKTDLVGYGTDAAGNSRDATPDIGAFESGASADTTAPVTAEVTPVSTPSPNQAPSYVFSSDEAGTVTYGGTCGNGSLSTAIVGNNTTSWALGIATYSDCTITVTDAASNASTPLAVQEFVITPVDSAAAKTIEGGVVFTTLP
jgi:hypothetical protein